MKIPSTLSLCNRSSALSVDKMRSVILGLAIYRSKVNTGLKNNTFFQNIVFPPKSMRWCLESLQEHTDKISLSSDEK